jgi:hypothetical protein
MVISGGNKDISINIKNNQPSPIEVTIDDLATNKIKNNNNNKKMPKYI